LSLFMFGIFANDHNIAIAFDYFTFVTNFLD